MKGKWRKKYLEGKKKKKKKAPPGKKEANYWKQKSPVER